MLVHLCDKCHNEIKQTRYHLRGFDLIVHGSTEYIILERDFCCLHCQQTYIINGMKGRGLDKDIKVQPKQGG